jgi:hypothetical protein
MGDNSEWLHSLTKDVKLSAHERHPTNYPLCVRLFFSFLLLFIYLFLVSFCFPILLSYCVLGTKGTSVQVWGCAMSHANPNSSPSPKLALSMLFTHWGQCVI